MYKKKGKEAEAAAVEAAAKKKATSFKVSNWKNCCLLHDQVVL